MKTFIDYRDLLPRITEDVIIDMLTEYGSPVYGDGETSEGQRYLIFRTVCHQGSSHKLYYYTETKTFHCYTNCGTMTVFDFVSKMNGFGEDEFYRSVQYVADKVGYQPPAFQTGFNAADEISVRKINDIIRDMEGLENKKGRFERPEITKFYDRALLNKFDKNTFYQGWLDEGMSYQTLHKYEICYYWDKQHIIIPHVNIKNDLVGIRRRSLDLKDINNKYMPEYINGMFCDHPLGLNLYGLYQNQKEIARRKTAIIFEGEKSVLLSDTYFEDRSIAVATCGFNISDWQINALAKLGVDTVYIAFDKDFDITKESLYSRNAEIYGNYQAYRRRLRNLVDKMLPLFTVKVILDSKKLLEEKDSPIDRGKDNFLQLVQSAKVCSDKKKI